ncbi:collagen alpha-1(I) chain-like [Trichechus manatus latirostris]|uniref:Collagen alpha-1(I) chain-like n=1 Tax=Trichechus manatus latirostris TaxID=127582 RepID=A0A2Y9FZQ5_TRIMA|nr:collagen alpha-1(I) chain-like [Trichechus manatus latirostris]
MVRPSGLGAPGRRIGSGRTSTQRPRPLRSASAALWGPAAAGARLMPRARPPAASAPPHVTKSQPWKGRQAAGQILPARPPGGLGTPGYSGRWGPGGAGELGMPGNWGLRELGAPIQ